MALEVSCECCLGELFGTVLWIWSPGPCLHNVSKVQLQTYFKNWVLQSALIERYVWHRHPPHDSLDVHREAVRVAVRILVEEHAAALLAHVGEVRVVPVRLRLHDLLDLPQRVADVAHGLVLREVPVRVLDNRGSKA